MQQFTVQSEAIRDKLNTLLPAQNLGSIGVELTGSTQIIPIVDLTEVAEGSNLRQDLQRSLSLTSCTAFSVTNQTTTLINTTGYFRIRGTYMGVEPGGTNLNTIQITDGTTTKILDTFNAFAGGGSGNLYKTFDFDVFLEAGDSITATSASSAFLITGTTRQIADLSGNLVNP
tara:strand:- start:684 stop:1202 length:519 start_codon:yes stop_codon:yes gene_type:complete